MKVVLDTDVVVAAVISPRGASRQWLRAAFNAEVTMLVSVPLAFEYEAVLKRPSILQRARLVSSDIDRLLDGLLRRSEQVAISFLWRPSLRDPGDDMVLEAGINGGADRLITFNLRDFGEAARFGITVEQPGTAWRRFMRN
jgi:putative PIN family toxin of toxin-antitoxin system